MNAADRLEQVPDRVLLMRGSKETHIDRPGAVYASIALPDIEAMTRKPARAAEGARSLRDFLDLPRARRARSHQAQAAHGQFVALPGDIDQGDPHLSPPSTLRLSRRSATSGASSTRRPRPRRRSASGGS
jgi:hypothetical protein